MEKITRKQYIAANTRSQEICMSFYVTKEEQKQIKKEADECKVTQSVYMRSRVLYAD